MKGSPYRKRYILIEFSEMKSADYLSMECRRIFNTREKYRDRSFIIIKTDQFLKDQVCTFVEQRIRGVRIITVSGTIKKCKRTMGSLVNEHLQII